MWRVSPKPHNHFKADLACHSMITIRLARAEAKCRLKSHNVVLRKAEGSRMRISQEILKSQRKREKNKETESESETEIDVNDDVDDNDKDNAANGERSNGNTKEKAKYT